MRSVRDAVLNRKRNEVALDRCGLGKGVGGTIAYPTQKE